MHGLICRTVASVRGVTLPGARGRAASSTAATPASRSTTCSVEQGCKGLECNILETWQQLACGHSSASRLGAQNLLCKPNLPDGSTTRLCAWKAQHSPSALVSTD